MAADIAYWPAMPRMKSMRPAIAERLDNPDVYTARGSSSTFTLEGSEGPGVSEGGPVTGKNMFICHMFKCAVFDIQPRYNY